MLNIRISTDELQNGRVDFEQLIKNKKLRGEKNEKLKNMIAMIGLMAVLGMATTTANAGILISDVSMQASATAQPCDAAETWGSLISGFLLGDVSTGCEQDGILISD